MDNTDELAHVELHAYDLTALCQVVVSVAFGLLLQLYWHSALFFRNMGGEFVEQRINVKYAVKLVKNVTCLITIGKLLSESHFCHFQALKRYGDVIW